MKILRQGDVLLVPVKRIPPLAKLVKRTGDVILALGEVTGHAHRIKTDGVTVHEHEGTRFVRIPKAKTPARLSHEEHGAIEIEPGEYEVRIQRQYAPEEKTGSTPPWRAVAD